jgi:hypothetical protein
MRVHLAMKHALQLEAPDVGFESLRVIINIACGRLVALAFRELEKLRGVRDPLGGTVDFASIGGQLRAFASQFLRPLGLRPDGRVFELTADLFEALFLIVVLKETPVRRRCAPRGL